MTDLQLADALVEAIKLLRDSGMAGKSLVETLKTKMSDLGFTQTEIAWVDLQ